MSALDSLKAIHLQNPENIIFSYININSIRNKFGGLFSLILSHVDILPIAETKLDYSFPNSQFLIPNFHQPFRLDITPFFYEQSIFDPRPENCLSFSKK